MIKDVARAIPGVEIYPIISLGIFFLFFTVLTVYVLRSKKKTMEEISRLPLQD
jgi:cytochrome c oxidase cbb3-type subunit IV